MPASLITGLRSVELEVADVPASARFYCDTWQLARTTSVGDATYLRATGLALDLSPQGDRSVAVVASTGVRGARRSNTLDRRW